MHLSHFLKIYHYEKKPGYLLLYSTKKSSKILLLEKTFSSITEGTLPPNDEALLLKLGMIVPDVEAEKKEVFGMLDAINEKNQTLNLSVIINLDCNFNCIYCYEGNMKGKHYMSDETANLLVNFIKSKFTPIKKKITIAFYGGEPLLSLKLIKTISAKLKTFAEAKGIKYAFSLVTNGSLFKRGVAEELSELGLSHIRTTIDGPPELHNTSRPFKSGGASFDAIIKNIKENCDVVKISVSGNYTKDNYKKFPQLFSHFEKEGITPEKLREVNFFPVMKNPGDVSALVDFNDGFMSVNEPWVIEAGAAMREEILKRGFKSFKVGTSPCQMDIKDDYVISVDGGIYKCACLIGRENFKIGDLESGVTKPTLFPSLWKNNHECKECKYLPLCFGGCRYTSYVRDGNIENVDCKKPHFDATLEEFIKQDIREA